LDLLDPSPHDIEIEDIAHGLARVARWNGQTRGPHVFSVAQHSLLVEAVSQRLSPDTDTQTLLGALLHDAAEYVIGDIISPFKAVLSDSYRTVEARILEAVRLRFGLAAHTTEAAARVIKQADQAAAYHEATRLAGFSIAEAELLFGPPHPLPADVLDLLDPMPTDKAEAAFLKRFRALDRTSGHIKEQRQ
ncbi:MAG: HD family hydrolase, partial [Beijerinckiaceae bacterium]|nr:HD family hydrolase [Beijerinckiaceae bacterium]